MVRLFLVDAFSSTPFSGNPAGVCLVPGPEEDSRLQQIAAEINAPETAFLYPQGSHYIIRWFTPATEVDLCGHATLAAAHILWEQGFHPPGEALLFYTRSGLISAEMVDGWITMDFPAEPAEETVSVPELSEIIGAKPVYTGKNRFDYLLEVGTEKEVVEASPDFLRLARLPARGTIITARSTNPEYDFVSRFFAPAVGINEDHVTGSAHCCLGPYWAKKLGKDRMTGFQVSARGGIVKVGVKGPRVELSGQAVTVMSGEILV